MNRPRLRLFTGKQETGPPAPPPGKSGPISALASWTQGVWEGIRGGMTAQGGFGGQGDKASTAQWNIGVLSRYEAQALYNTSWAARRVLRVPVVDSLSRWRTFVEEGSSNIEEQMRDAEKQIGLVKAISDAWVSARLHGTACIAIITMEDDMTNELVPDRIRPGDLRNLLVFDKWDMSALDFESDLSDPNFGKPSMWRITSRWGHELVLHPSRVIVFYGNAPLTTNAENFGTYDAWWEGTSVLESVLKAINSDELAASAMAQGLADNATLFVKSEGLTEKSIENPGAVSDKLMSLARMQGLSTILMNHEDEAQRLSSPVSGTAPALVELGKRVAHAAGIPEARFLGIPGGGFASSEPEHLAYSEHIRALQESVLSPILDRLDPIVARNAGIKEAPEYEWVPLVTLAEKVTAETEAMRVDTASKMLAGKLATIEEVRTWMREHESFEPVLEEGVPDGLEPEKDDDLGQPEDDDGDPEQGDSGGNGEETDEEGD